MTSSALTLSRPRAVLDVLLAGAGRWGPWAAFPAGIVLSLARRDPHALGQPVVLLFIASSALGIRLRARR